MPEVTIPPAPPTLAPRALIVIGIVALSMAAGTTGLQSVMPALGRKIGVADWQVAGAFSLSALLWTLASPVWGRISEQRGRKPLMLLGLGGFAVSMLGCGIDVLAGLHGAAPPLWIFGGFAVLRAIYGLLGSAAGVASQAYVADNTAGAARTASLAQLAGATGLGTILGPAVAPLLVFPGVDLSGPMLGFGVAAILVFLMVRLTVAESARAERIGAALARPVVAPGLWRDRRFASLLVCGLLLTSAQAVNGFVVGFQVIDTLGRDPAQAQRFIVYVLIAGSAVSLVAQWGVAAWLRLPAAWLLRLGLAAACGGNVVLVAAGGYGALLLGYALACFGYALARPGFAAAMSLAGMEHEQGWAAGAVSAVNGACVIATPMLGVLLYEASHTAPFALNAVLLFGLFVWRLNRHPAPSGAIGARG